MKTTMELAIKTYADLTNTTFLNVLNEWKPSCNIKRSKINVCNNIKFINNGV